jgi:hypothetical protein
MIDSFIQSDLNMVLYMSSRPKVMYVLTFVGPSYSISRGKNNLLSIDLLQRINDTMFNKPFVNQYRFDYFEPNNNEDNVC